MRGTKRRSDEATKGRRLLHPWSLRRCVASSLLLAVIGCTSQNAGDHPQTWRQKKEQAVRDPMNYKPDNENTQPYDISGGGFNNLDNKALKKDLSHALDP